MEGGREGSGIIDKKKKESNREKKGRGEGGKASFYLGIEGEADEQLQSQPSTHSKSFIGVFALSVCLSHSGRDR